MNDKNNLVLFSGNSNPELANKIAKKLNTSLGKALSRITAVIPYFGYARQDRRVRSERVPISAKLVADMLQSAGADRILTIELHSDQIQGFFNVPVDNVYGTKVIHNHIDKSSYKDQIIVSPDVGGVVRARALAKLLNDADLAIIDKRREKENSSQVMNVIGDVEGKTCILVDDIIDTAGTICNAADALKQKGANKVISYATHAVLSGPAIERLKDAPIDKIIVSDTIDISNNKIFNKLEIVSVAEVFAEAIIRINKGDSISELFK